MPQARVIKKYPNRRLYDTDISSYITLEDVRQLILDGEAFQVLDARSGDDITRSVLLQIIAEHEQRGQPMLSSTLLAQVIGLYGDPLQGLLGEYMQRSLQLFVDQREALSGAGGFALRDAMDALEARNRALLQTLGRELVAGMLAPARGASK